MTHQASASKAGGDGRRRWRRIGVRLLVVAGIIGMALIGVTLWAARVLPGIVAEEIGRLTNAQVRMGAFDLHMNGSVSIDGLVMRPRQQEPDSDNAILRAGSVCACFDRRSLLWLSPRISEIRLDDFTLDAQLNLDTGQWNVGSLRFRVPKGDDRGTMPLVNLRKGKFQYCRVSDGNREVVMSVPIEARFGRNDEAQWRYIFEVRIAKPSGGYGESHLRGSWRPGELILAGGLSSTDIPALERAWTVGVLAAELKYEQSRDYTLDLRLKDLHGKQAPEVDALRLLVPTAAGEGGPLGTLQRFFARYRPTGRVGSIDIKAGGNFARLLESEVTGKLVCRDVSICDQKFPYRIDHLAGALNFTQSTVLVDRLSGRHGAVEVQIEGWTKGYGDQRQYQCRIASGNMLLDETLYAALNPEQKRLWDAFQPSGTVAADYRLTRVSPTDKRTYVSVGLQGVKAAYREFPYPLTDLTGQLHFDRENIVISDIVSQAAGQQIRFNGKVTERDTGKPVYYITIDANDVPLDATLGESLPPRHRGLYQRLQAGGRADMHATVFTTPEAQHTRPVSFLADVSCEKASLKPDQLPFVLSNVTAEASLTPDSLSIRKLTGWHGGSPVTIAGGVQLAANDKLRQYHLKMTAEQVPLNDETIGWLPRSLAQQVAAFRPQGSVNVTTELKKSDANEAPGYVITMECLGNGIHHQSFPYPLEEVRGTVTITNEGMTLQGVTARAAGASAPQATAVVQMDGSVGLRNGGFDRGSFAIKACDVLLTSDLEKVLPKNLVPAYHDLSLGGRIDLDVPILNVSRVGEKEHLVEFAGRASSKACHLSLSGAQTEFHGTLQAQGSYQTGHGLLAGGIQLAAERLTVRGRTVTNLNMDAGYDPTTQKWSAENFLGDCCGGKVLGNLEVVTAGGTDLTYLLRLVLHRVDLRQFLVAGKTGEAAEKQYSSGVMNASLSLGARVGDSASRRGACQVDIADMQVGKVSPLAGLLSVLRLSEPTAYTFERMWIDSHVRQNMLVIRTFDMSGRDVAFTGSGKMDLMNENVNLSLTARGRRVGTAEPSVLQSLTEGLGSAVVRMEVTGKAGKPRVETKALPVIEDSLKILGTPQ